MTKPNWEPIVIRLGDIIPWTENPRMSTKAQAERLIASEKKFGQPQPFSVSPFDENGKVQLYDGHQRYGAWLTVYGENHKVYASQCDRYLTEEERAEYVFTFHAGAVGMWNWDKAASFPTPVLVNNGFDALKLKELNNDASNLREMLLASDEVPDFQPVGIDEQGRLDQKKPVICPECGHEFTPK